MATLKRYRVILSAFIAVVLLFGFTIPVYAAENLPTVQTIDQIEVYRDALGEDNSQLWLVRFNCTENSTLDIDETFLFILKNSTTNATVGTTLAYAYPSSGYDNGIITFEFAANSALLPTWSGNYTLYFYGNPTLSWVGGVPPTVQSSAITWHDEGSVADAQDRLTARLRYIANQLENEWAVDLITTGSTGTVLTTSGEDYFTNSISGLRHICPDIFYQTMQAVEYEHDILITDMLSSGNDTTILVNNTDYCAQSFIPSESYSITGMNMMVYRVLVPGTLTVGLRTVLAGGDLVSGTYNTSTITTNATIGEWINVAFTSDSALMAGTTYYLVARTSGIPGNEIRWFADTDNGYANGSEYTYTGGAWNPPILANDLLFEIEGRGAVTMGLASRVESRLVGTQFDFTNWAAGFGLSRIWWSTIFWIAISMVVMVAAAFGSNAWDCSMVVLIMMLSYGWRGGWVDTIVFALIVALLSGGLIYAIFWKKA